MTDAKTGELVSPNAEQVSVDALQNIAHAILGGLKAEADATRAHLEAESTRDHSWRLKVFGWVAVPWSFAALATFGFLIYRNDISIAATIATHALAALAGFMTGYKHPRKKPE